LKRTFTTDRVHTLLFDVRDKKAEKASASLPEAFSTIDILINNMATHGLDPIQNGDLTIGMP
jgi:NADP-dependent 3-hydroxy acid dehydrogenase YdfG